MGTPFVHVAKKDAMPNGCMYDAVHEIIRHRNGASREANKYARPDKSVMMLCIYEQPTAVPPNPCIGSVLQ